MRWWRENIPHAQRKQRMRLSFPFRSNEAFSVSLRTFVEVDVKTKQHQQQQISRIDLYIHFWYIYIFMYLVFVHWLSHLKVAKKKIHSSNYKNKRLQQLYRLICQLVNWHICACVRVFVSFIPIEKPTIFRLESKTKANLNIEENIAYFQFAIGIFNGSSWMCARCAATGKLGRN